MDESHAKKISYVTGILIAINILYFLYLELTGSTENTIFMIDHGAMYAPLVWEEGEYYRLVTSMFMHFGIQHLCNNMLVLFIVGDNVERALGKVRYLILYFFCGVGANVISTLVGIKDYGRVVSAGASGAVFGVIGALLIVVLKNKGRFDKLQIRQLVIMILFSLYSGFTSAGIDNVAHVAGLILGILFTLVCYRAPKKVPVNAESILE